MDKFLKVLGAVFLVALLGIAIAVAVMLPRGMALDEEAAAYVEANIPLLVAEWDAEELKRRAAPELLAGSGAEQMPRMFTYLSALGKLQKLEKPVGRVGTGVYPGSEFNGTWGDYVTNATFDAGPAQVKMVLKRDGASWQIMGFHIRSAALLSQVQQPTAAEPAER